MHTLNVAIIQVERHMWLYIVASICLDYLLTVVGSELFGA